MGNRGSKGGGNGSGKAPVKPTGPGAGAKKNGFFVPRPLKLIPLEDWSNLRLPGDQRLWKYWVWEAEWAPGFASPWIKAALSFGYEWSNIAFLAPPSMAYLLGDWASVGYAAGASALALGTKTYVRAVQMDRFWQYQYVNLRYGYANKEAVPHRLIQLQTKWGDKYDLANPRDASFRVQLTYGLYDRNAPVWEWMSRVNRDSAALIGTGKFGLIVGTIVNKSLKVNTETIKMLWNMGKAGFAPDEKTVEAFFKGTLVEKWKGTEYMMHQFATDHEQLLNDICASKVKIAYEWGHFRRFVSNDYAAVIRIMDDMGIVLDGTVREAEKPEIEDTFRNLVARAARDNDQVKYQYKVMQETIKAQNLSGKDLGAYIQERLQHGRVQNTSSGMARDFADLSRVETYIMQDIPSGRKWLQSLMEGVHGQCEYVRERSQQAMVMGNEITQRTYQNIYLKNDNATAAFWAENEDIFNVYKAFYLRDSEMQEFNGIPWGEVRLHPFFASPPPPPLDLSPEEQIVWIEKNREAINKALSILYHDGRQLSITRDNRKMMEEVTGIGSRSRAMDDAVLGPAEARKQATLLLKEDEDGKKPIEEATKRMSPTMPVEDAMNVGTSVIASTSGKSAAVAKAAQLSEAQDFFNKAYADSIESESRLFGGLMDAVQGEFATELGFTIMNDVMMGPAAIAYMGAEAALDITTLILEAISPAVPPPADPMIATTTIRLKIQECLRDRQLDYSSMDLHTFAFLMGHYYYEEYLNPGGSGESGSYPFKLWGASLGRPENWDKETLGSMFWYWSSALPVLAIGGEFTARGPWQQGYLYLGPLGALTAREMTHLTNMIFFGRELWGKDRGKDRGDIPFDLSFTDHGTFDQPQKWLVDPQNIGAKGLPQWPLIDARLSPNHPQSIGRLVLYENPGVVVSSIQMRANVYGVKIGGDTENGKNLMTRAQIWQAARGFDWSASHFAFFDPAGFDDPESGASRLLDWYMEDMQGKPDIAYPPWEQFRIPQMGHTSLLTWFGRQARTILYPECLKLWREDENRKIPPPLNYYQIGLRTCADNQAAHKDFALASPTLREVQQHTPEMLDILDKWAKGNDQLQPGDVYFNDVGIRLRIRFDKLLPHITDSSLSSVDKACLAAICAYSDVAAEHVNAVAVAFRNVMVFAFKNGYVPLFDSMLNMPRIQAELTVTIARRVRLGHAVTNESMFNWLLVNIPLTADAQHTWLDALRWKFCALWFIQGNPCGAQLSYWLSMWAFEVPFVRAHIDSWWTNLDPYFGMYRAKDWIQSLINVTPVVGDLDRVAELFSIEYSGLSYLGITEFALWMNKKQESVDWFRTSNVPAPRNKWTKPFSKMSQLSCYTIPVDDRATNGDECIQRVIWYYIMYVAPDKAAVTWPDIVAYLSSTSEEQRHRFGIKSFVCANNCGTQVKIEMAKNCNVNLTDDQWNWLTAQICVPGAPALSFNEIDNRLKGESKWEEIKRQNGCLDQTADLSALELGLVSLLAGGGFVLGSMLLKK
jgi:hypothetical protein